jgi:hypothetical protein
MQRRIPVRAHGALMRRSGARRCGLRTLDAGERIASRRAPLRAHGPVVRHAVPRQRPALVLPPDFLPLVVH